MTTRDEMETRLLQAVAIEPSEAGLRWLDQRVANVAERPVALPRRGLFARRLILRPVLLLAAFLLLAGAVAAGLGLLDRIVESSGQPGWHTAWDRAERLDLTATDAGVTIKVERAYADLNQVLVGFTVAGLEVPTTAVEEPPALQWIVEIRDPSGRGSEEWTKGGGGMGLEETGLSAVVQTWEGAVTPAAGTWVLTFSSVGYNGGGFVPGQCDVDATEPECVNPPPSGMVDGTWQFEFVLPAPAGRVVAADVSDTVGQAILHLTELRITPTMITARIGLSVDGSPVAGWLNLQPIAVRRDGASFNANSAWVVNVGDAGERTGETIFFTTSGADEAAGTWEIQIPELTYQLSDNKEVPLSGPWTLTVTVP